jgi:RNA polymerase sigma factor (sigma-70 family)
MKKYNLETYIRYKEDLKESIPSSNSFMDLSRDGLIVKFLPLVENLARKFPSSEQSIGILTINDLIQIGSEGLTRAVDKIDRDKLSESEDIEKTLKSFLSKRVKGAIRRRIDINRSNMRIPEYKRNQMRNNPNDKKAVEMFFNSIFLSIDNTSVDENGETLYSDVMDSGAPYNIALLNAYLNGLMKKHLNDNEYEVLRLSYGLDCEKHSGKEIARELGFVGTSNHVRVSELKKKAVQSLIDNVDHSQVIDYL